MLIALYSAAFLAIAGTVALVALSRGERKVGTVDGRLRPCSSASNCACSEDSGESAVEPFAIPDGVSPRTAFEALEFVLMNEADVRTRSEGYVHAVYTTPLLRFRDDFEARLDGGRDVIHVRSSSRVGRSDLGANRRRVEALRGAWSVRLRASRQGD